jgi:hypothetical protein
VTYSFRAIDEIMVPEMTPFVILDPSAPNLKRPVTLQDTHERASSLALPDSVPDNVRVYWDATLMLWLHGFFYYPFYSMAVLHAGLAAEMALRERLIADAAITSDKLPPLRWMLSEAVKRGLLVPEKFTNIQRHIERREEWRETLLALGELDSEFVTPPQISAEAQQAELLEAMARHLDSFRHLRNSRAHPKQLMVMFPSMTHGEINYARDLIVQVFSAT